MKQQNFYSDTVVTIFNNLNGAGFRFQQTNNGHLKQSGNVYRTKEEVLRAAAAAGFTYYFAPWTGVSCAPATIPARFYKKAPYRAATR